MPVSYRLTQSAVEDIHAIYRYGAQQFGLKQADAYHSQLERAFEFLAINPLAARARLELSPPVRIHPVGSHLVIYQVDEDGVLLIIRVRHAHEDWSDPLTGE
jgi:toxin ParE1/3/4